LLKTEELFLLKARIEHRKRDLGEIFYQAILISKKPDLSLVTQLCIDIRQLEGQASALKTEAGDADEKTASYPSAAVQPPPPAPPPPLRGTDGPMEPGRTGEERYQGSKKRPLGLLKVILWVLFLAAILYFANNTLL
jgi:hypothetical protein